MSPFKQLFIIIICFCVGFLLSTSVVGVLYLFMHGEYSYKLLLIISSVISFGLSALFAAKFIGNGEMPFRFMGMAQSPNFVKYILAIAFMLAIMPTIEFISSLNACYSFPDSMKGIEDFFRAIDESANQSTLKALSGEGVGAFVLNLIAIAITPAICEEMFFRGVFQKYLVGNMKNPHVAILITAFIFSAIHMQFSGLVPRFILGMVLGYLFYMSGSLWLSIVAHVTNNALVVIVAFFYKDFVTVNSDLGAYANPWWIAAIVGGLVIAGLVVWLWKRLDAGKSQS